MKKIILAILITCAFFGANAQNTTGKPNESETVSYINKIIKGCQDFEVVYSSGAKFKLMLSYGSEYGLNYIVIVEQDPTKEYCTTVYDFNEIDFAKMTGISEDTNISDASPVKYLKVYFLANSVLQKGRIYGEKTKEPCSSDATFRKSVSSILVPYRNEPGLKDRLIKALTHYSNLRKEEVKKNDPFGN